MQNSKRRSYAHETLRKYSMSKRKPRRTRVEVSEDLGDKERKSLWTFPEQEPIQHDIPKTKSGKWVEVWRVLGIKLRLSLTTKRFFLYDLNDRCLGEIHFSEIWKMGMSCLETSCGFNEEISGRYGGQIYRRYLLRSYKRAKREFDSFRPNFARKRA